MDESRILPIKNVKLEEGEQMFREGEAGSWVYFVAHGTLGVLKATDAGQSVALATLRRGRSIGEMAVVDEFPRSATVRARTKATLLMISRQHFDTVLEEYPRIGIKVLKGIARQLSQSLRKTARRLADYMLPLG